ncbi:anti-sigma factor family protein [Jiangella muralis]|uniref:anti-sigma factor family protein n=1 Tax=Jiangella muralis TaxID=702383 RepID=UPI00069F39B1|nr:hypothetical protein [Jiangella muralis]
MTTAGAHPPSHVLADLAEGVLDDAQARQVQAHVDQCLSCQATLDELAQVTVALRALPAEIPVPEFVAVRISHALAAERASGDAASAASAGSAGDGTVAWFRRRLPQGLAAAASVAVLGLAGYVAVGGGGGGSDSGGDGDVAAAEAQGGADDVGPSFSTPSDLARDGTLSTMQEPAPTVETPADAAPEALDPARLTTAVTEVVQGDAEPAGSDTCGEELADELGLPLVGSTNVGSGVLIVLDDATTYDGWLITTCGSTSNETMQPQVEVPKSE